MTRVCRWSGVFHLSNSVSWRHAQAGKISDIVVSSSPARRSGWNKSRAGTFRERSSFIARRPLMNEHTSFAARGVAIVFASLLLAVGVSVGGSFVGDGIANWNSGRRIIAVKGLSEREMPASVATWSIGYRATGNDLLAINRKLTGSTKIWYECK